MSRVACLLVSLFLFTLLGRFFEHYLVQRHGPLIISCLALAAVILGGRVPALFRHPVTKSLLALSAWLVLATFFSIWMGGSAQVVFGIWLKSLLVYFLVTGAAVTSKQAVGLIRAGAFGYLMLAVFALTKGHYALGRLSMDWVNPNHLALGMLTGTILWSVHTVAIRNRLTRSLSWAVLPLLPIVLVQTASRGTLVALCVVLVVLLWRLSFGRKVQASFVGLALFVVLLAVPSTRNAFGLYLTRMESTFADNIGVFAHGTNEYMAYDSRESRLGLLLDSLRATIRHPLLGVGPGNFMIVLGQLRDERNERGYKVGTHNTYTQYSAEAGLPALAFFLMAVWYCVKDLREVKDTPHLSSLVGEADRSRIQSLCSTIQLLWIAYGTAFLFTHIGYQVFIPTLLGLSVAFSATLRTELAALTWVAGREAPTQAAS